MRNVIRAAAAILITVLAAACGGSSAPVDDTNRPISDHDLSEMALRLEQHPVDYSGFQADDKNGVRSIDAEADDALEPDKTRARLQKYGFVSDYHWTFHTAEFDGSTPGVYSASGHIDLLEDASKAAGDFRDVVDEIRGLTGVTRGSVTVDKAELIDYSLADQAVASRYEVRIKPKDKPELNVFIVEVDFRHGRLVGEVDVGAFGFTDLDKANLEGRVKDLARILNENIKTVLATPPTQ